MSILGEHFDLDESAPIAQQIASALKAKGKGVLDFFREVDANEDRVITKKEWRAEMARLGLEALHEEMDATFDEWDTDHDGQMTFEELKKVLK